MALRPASLLLTLALGCAGPPAVVDAGFESRLTVELDELPARARLADDQDFRVVELGRDAHSSHHIVAIRHGETLHHHARHDLLVVMVEGHGTMQLGNERRTVGEGSVLYVPRGTNHAFTNASDAPATAYAIYLPAFDGKDRREAE